MVRAILDGRKTQTRRVIRRIPSYYVLGKTPEYYNAGEFAFLDMGDPVGTYPTYAKCPYGKPGDLLWVRERMTLWPGTVAIYDCDSEEMPTPHQEHQRWLDDYSRATVPSIHMPKWATRIWLEITNIRAERLHEITPQDILREGIEYNTQIVSELRLKFQLFWDSLNAKRGFANWEEYWVPQYRLEPGYYDFVWSPGEQPVHLRYWPPWFDKLTGKWVGPCVGEDPEAMMLDVIEPSLVRIILPTGEQIGVKKIRKRIVSKSEENHFVWETNPWVWVIEFKRINKNA